MKRTLLVLLASACLTTVLPLQAETWPTRTIKFVVPYPPGGPVDRIARLLAPALRKELGQPLIVDNRAGAAGQIGISTVVKGEPDGYTFGMGVLGVLAVAPHIGKMQFKPEDVNYVTLLTQSPHVLVVNPSQGFQDLEGFIEAARKSPGKLNYGSAGTGSSTHLDGELLALEAGLDIQHVPYKGGAEAITALLSKEVEMLALEVSAVLPQRTKLKVVAVMGDKRSPLFPDAPTTAELGFPKVIASSMYGVIAPTNTPKDITEKFGWR